MSSISVFADYHFHPNFQFHPSKIRKKATKIWDAFAGHGLNVVVVSEHSYKRPVDAFHLLEESRPAGASTLLLPGVEVLTAEGLDVIVFGPDPRWYEDRATSLLLRPYEPSIAEVASILAASDHLAGFLPHPFTLGTTGAVRWMGTEDSRQLARQLGGVETSNNCYSDAIFLADRAPLAKRCFPESYKSMLLTQQIDELFTQEWENGFFAIGSDAHYPEELGHGVVLTDGAALSQAEEAFAALCANRNHEGESRGSKVLRDRVYHFTKSACITGHEYLLKRAIRKHLRRQGTTRPVLAPTSS